MTHPSHTFFFEIWRGENRHPAVPIPPLGSQLAFSPPRRHRGERTPPHGGRPQGDPQHPPHPDWRPSGNAARPGRAEPPQRGKERGRAGAAAEGRGLPAPPLCCTAEAPSSRASAPPARWGGSGWPRPPPPGHRLPAGPLRQQAEGSGRRPAHLRHPRPQPGPRPRGGCHRLRRRASFPSQGDAPAFPARSLAARP